MQRLRGADLEKAIALFQAGKPTAQACQAALRRVVPDRPVDGGGHG
jgi:hypothetical protein